MKDYNDDYNIGFENALTDIESYKQRYHQLKEMDIVSKEEKTRQAKLKCEESFKTSFISGLNEKIENAKKDIAELNKGLAQRELMVKPMNSVFHQLQEMILKNTIRSSNQERIYGE